MTPSKDVVALNTGAQEASELETAIGAGERKTILRQASDGVRVAGVRVGPEWTEKLEQRVVLNSASVSSGILTLNGSSSTDNNMSVTLDRANNRLITSINGVGSHFTRQGLTGIVINGGTARDNIEVGNDVNFRVTVNASAGDDVITTGGWNDRIFAGPGNDLIRSNAGQDFIDAGDGNDTIYAGDGNDTVYAGAGDDFIDAGAGNDFVDGGSGSDIALNAERRSQIEATTGVPGNPTTPSNPPANPNPPTNPNPPANPTPTGGTASVSNNRLLLQGNASTANNLRVSFDRAGNRYVAHVNGTQQGFSRNGLNGIVINGGTGNDTILVDRDVTLRVTVNAGAGNDSITTADWNDYISGGEGNDTINAGGGTDTVDGGAGFDIALNAEIRTGVEQTTPNPTTPPTNPPTDPPTDPTNPPTNPNPPTDPLPPTNPTPAGLPPVLGNGTAPIARISLPTGAVVPLGHSIHVDALASTLNAGNPTTARFEWDFGDPGSAYNKMVGYNAAHTYARTGTYTVSLRVFNETGRFHTASTTVTITNADRRIYHVASNGNDSNPGTEAQPIRTFNRVIQLLSNAASDIEIRFRRGETFSVGNEAIVINGQNIVIGAYGTGNKPVIRWAGDRDRRRFVITSNTSARNLTIENLTFDSIYNTPDGDQRNMVVTILPAGRNTTIRNNTFLNVGYAINGNSRPEGVLVQNNDAPLVTGIRDYFMWIDATNVVLAGNSIANSTREHVVRISGASRVLVTDNVLTNLDRRGQGDNFDTAKGALSIQKSDFVYAAENRINGPAGFGPLGEADGLTDTGGRTRFGVFEGNHMINAPFLIKHGAERIMVRNNLLENHGENNMLIEGYDSTYRRGVVDVTLVNNTGYNNQQYGQFLRVMGPVDGITMQNNLYIAPNYVTGEWASAAVQVFQNDLSSFRSIDRNVWENPTRINWWSQGGVMWVGPGDAGAEGYQTPAEWNDFPQVGTDLFADTPTVAGNNFRPTSGAVAARSGVAIRGVFTDYFGNYRPASNWSAGAIQA